MLRSAQAQSEEEQLRNALEASRNTAAAAAAEADLVRQAIAESMGPGAGSCAGAGGVVEDGSVGKAGEGAADGPTTATPSATAVAAAGEPGQERQAFVGSSGAAATAAAAGAVGSGEEDEELKRALLMSGMAAGGTWETLPAEAGGPAKAFEIDDDDAELRLAIEASLAGE